MTAGRAGEREREPALLQAQDLRGDLHTHTGLTDGIVPGEDDRRPEGARLAVAFTPPAFDLAAVVAFRLKVTGPPPAL